MPLYAEQLLSLHVLPSTPPPAVPLVLQPPFGQLALALHPAITIPAASAMPNAAAKNNFFFIFLPPPVRMDFHTLGFRPLKFPPSRAGTVQNSVTI
jgi:hypothetical protein